MKEPEYSELEKLTLELQEKEKSLIGFLLGKQNKVFSDIFIIVTAKNGSPCLELRKSFTDKEMIKTIITAAFRGQPLIIMPTVRDRIKAINSLIEKGILYQENGEYFFL